MKKIVLILFAIIIYSCSLAAQDNIDIVKKGDKLPSFRLESKQYGNIDSEQLKGKVTLILIFATWCGPCQLELAALQDAIDTQKIPFAKDNAELAILIVGREHNEDELIKYNEKKGFTFPIYPDPAREFTAKFAKQSIPRTYLADQTGKIVYTSTGYNQSDFNKLVNNINKLLKKK